MLQWNGFAVVPRDRSSSSKICNMFIQHDPYFSAANHIFFRILTFLIFSKWNSHVMTFKKGLKDKKNLTLTKMEKKHVNKWRSSSQKGCREDEFGGEEHRECPFKNTESHVVAVESLKHLRKKTTLLRPNPNTMKLAYSRWPQPWGVDFVISFGHH